MIVNVPTRICNLMRERAKRMSRFPDVQAEIHRALVEAWTEGVTHAWTLQNIEETKRR